MNASFALNLNLNVQLPPRTGEVAGQVITGFSKKYVADLFKIKYYTVVNHVRIACQKTGARNIVELALWFRLKEDHVSLIISDGKRVIVTACFLLLIVSAEVFSLMGNVTRTRARAKTAYTARARRNEIDNYIDYLLTL
jgi:DNA-binding CsgD family transcriptional regulator